MPDWQGILCAISVVNTTSSKNVFAKPLDAVPETAGESTGEGAGGEQPLAQQEGGPSRSWTGGPPSTHSKVTSASTASRKRRLELQAAEERAKIRKAAIQERERIDLELVDQRLQADLLDAEDENRAQGSREASIGDTAGGAIERNIHQWMEDSERIASPPMNEAMKTVEPEQPARSLGESSRDGIRQLTAAITRTLDAVQENNASERTTGHLVNRLSSMKDRPVFGGDVLEWPAFRRAFHLSTAKGAYSEEENLARLYGCLRGKAREAVSSLMITKKTTAEIIGALQLRFGNPDMVAQKVLQEIKRLPKIEAGLGNLVVVATQVRNCVAAMEAANHLGYLHSPELGAQIIDRMPPALIHQYTRFAQGSQEPEEPRLVRLANFLFCEAELVTKAGICRVTEERPSQAGRRVEGQRGLRRANARLQRDTVLITHKSATDDRPTRKGKSDGTRRSERCGYCKAAWHTTFQCPQFKKISVQERWKWARRTGVCFLCLVEKHQRSRCEAARCDRAGCDQAHHTLLHGASGRAKKTTEIGPSRSETQDTDREVTANTWSQGSRRILLKVLPVCLTGPRGDVNTYALLDEGSTVTLVDAGVAKAIGAHGAQIRLSLQGVRGMEISEPNSKTVTFAISGTPHGPSYTVSGARTVQQLALPCQSLREEDLKRFEHLGGVTAECYSNADPKVLLGQDNWDLIISREVREAGRNAPVASRTGLGWVIHGYAPSRNKRGNGELALALNDPEACGAGYADMGGDHRNEDLHALIKANFAFEGMGITVQSRKPAAIQRAEKLLDATTRQIEGQWETGLLWRHDTIEFPDSRNTALNRLEALERKMDRNPEFRAAYQKEVNSLLESGYATRVGEAEDCSKRVWYLPHFGVTNPNKPGKLRLVFDAAAKTRGVSLNDKLLSGPDLLNSLLGVLMRFRQRRVAFTGDIKEMFLRIKIRPEDRCAQRFLWREERGRQPDTYHMTSMIFGAASSPCSALYVKNINARAFEEKFPTACNAIIKKHYMDDYLDSVDTEEEAIRLIREVTEIHRQGGFEIRGWSSNSERVQSSLTANKAATGNVNLALCEHPVERTLGVMWNPCTDTLSFDLSMKKIPTDIMEGRRKPTKREMLRVIMSVFDPQGFLAPFTIRSKLLLQNVWRSGIGWDTQLKDEEYELWQRWMKDLKNITGCTVPRCYAVRAQQPIDAELHVFCDASEKAFAAVAYWRLRYDATTTDVAFIAGKSRVAPLKLVSIPRMELQAAVLAVRLAQTITEEHEIKASKRRYWTDSRTVLLWIKSDPRKYKAFVAHRLGEIDDMTKVDEWRWVPTKQNPADDATRGNETTLTANSRWLQGPSFLTRDESEWPTSIPLRGLDRTRGEQRRQFVAVSTEKLQSSLPSVNRFSSWLRLVRATAWVLVFIARCRKTSNSGINSEYIERAERLWMKKAQEDSFGPELVALKQGQAVDRSSRLFQLSPTVDASGLMRLQGRISATVDIPEAMKFPVILDGRHPYTRLLAMHYHQRAGHGSPETVVNELRQRYWVLNLRPTVRQVASHCQWCRVQRAKPQQPRMGDLPHARDVGEGWFHGYLIVVAASFTARVDVADYPTQSLCHE
ncbi:uncharacterized protein LOC111674124 [Orussus abietinus]|uniref:uncharacterized protein LOC111674124 n=1 Tax=Orussus abietinus TaxID=222816 RepID=UPI000C715E37|nr:uncharacterized protein LOC111674124 [Orussus abietinus]